MGRYFDNLDNNPLNKYKKILKIEKSLYMCSSTFTFKFHSNFMQFHYHLIVYQIFTICNGFNLTIFDGLLNDNEIT
jgi:hypothetical protein